MLHALDHLIAEHGIWVVTLILALESMGVPLPGESLLIGAAIYASTTHKLSIVWLLIAAATGAILGDNAGFVIGRRAGRPLLLRYGRYVGLTEQRLRVGEALFRLHGGKVVFFGRFIAILRTFAALLAGAQGMAWPHFLVWNAAGGIAWTGLYGGGAYLLGDEAKRISGPLGVGVAVIAGAAVVAAIIVVRRRQSAIIAAAERQGAT